jgi:hypothetical protein
MFRSDDDWCMCNYSFHISEIGILKIAFHYGITFRIFLERNITKDGFILLRG